MRQRQVRQDYIILIKLHILVICTGAQERTVVIV